MIFLALSKAPLVPAWYYFGGFVRISTPFFLSKAPLVPPVNILEGAF